METISNKKISLVILRENISVLEQEQRFLKNQRKTVNLFDKRKMETWKAQMTHRINREKLRVMYAAYGLARGKTYSQVENVYPEENHPLKNYQSEINKILEDYGLQYNQ
jgi:hypothetical protein